MNDHFYKILLECDIDDKIGHYGEHFDELDIVELREVRTWLEKYLQFLDEQGDYYADVLEQLDPVVDKKRYKTTDAILYNIGDARLHTRKRLHETEKLIDMKRHGPIFCTSKEHANMKALNHGGIYNNCGSDQLLICHPGRHRGVIRGVSL